LINKIGSRQRYEQLSELSEEAQGHIRAFRRFYLWAGPLHEAGHIVIAKNTANIDHVIAKRFRISGGTGSQPLKSPMRRWSGWLEMPWASAGINIPASRIYLFAKPAEPIKQFVVTIPVEDFEILEPFKKVLSLDFFLSA